MTTITLITGPNRGIGHGILTTILARPNNTVIAAVRDPQAAASQNLKNIPKAEGTSLHIIKIHSAVPTDPAAAVKTLAAAGISHIDTVIANAAIADTTSSVLAVSPDDIQRHLDVNLFGVLALFQAVEPLLKNGTNPKFIGLTSTIGSNELVPSMPGPWFCYGVTKVALNHLIRRVHVENEWLTAVALHPGWVQTEMGNFAARTVGMDNAPDTLQDSVDGCLKVIDAASREKYAGQFLSSTGETVPW